ncbi:hypothetical protein DPMN_036822 [Dreissena polymorpha]|uniref:Uncharacterized protein n=1 Tax=Dreissena polymorpha TaxID=45954 RepID=A0A9D4RM85_DREPO|nr:hypothetical protein DPMN_036822 [Dreissena polymorpha]
MMCPGTDVATLPSLRSGIPPPHVSSALRSPGCHCQRTSLGNSCLAPLPETV